MALAGLGVAILGCPFAGCVVIGCVKIAVPYLSTLHIVGSTSPFIVGTALITIGFNMNNNWITN